MAKMRDAEIRDLKDENRIAMPLGATVIGANICWHIADADVLVLDIDAGRLLIFGPTTQYILDARIGRQAVMRAVRVIHRCNIRQHRRLDVIVVISRDAYQLWALDQECRVADISQTRLTALK